MFASILYLNGFRFVCLESRVHSATASVHGPRTPRFSASGIDVYASPYRLLTLPSAQHFSHCTLRAAFSCSIGFQHALITALYCSFPAIRIVRLYCTESGGWAQKGDGTGLRYYPAYETGRTAWLHACSPPRSAPVQCLSGALDKCTVDD